MKKSLPIVLLLVSGSVLMAQEPAGIKLSGYVDTEMPDYVGMIFVFMLSTFIGLQVINQVSRLLHTPLMSLTNAISAIAVVGAILVGGRSYVANDEPTWINILGLIAIVASVTNIVSGFLITDRMLKMFKRKEGK
ncbi:MAG: NAD(P) transhydrogenase subunit alpha [Verrucomicrobiales bacterium]|nr:NAD(P) transhydrogenase subunit alpha [Verrucomicrobiales bacterium]